MNRTKKFNLTLHLSLLVLVAALTVVSAASARVSVGGLPPGKLCGSVSGGSWKYQGQTGRQYNVTGTAKSCPAAMKSVSGLTKQKPHTGVLGPRTLTGPRGFRCVGSGIISPASAGFCGGSNGAKFFWAPRLKK